LEERKESLIVTIAIVTSWVSIPGTLPRLVRYPVVLSHALHRSGDSMRDVTYDSHIWEGFGRDSDPVALLSTSLDQFKKVMHASGARS